MGTKVLGLSTSYNDKLVAVILAVILIVVLTMLIVNVRNGSSFYYGLNLPVYALPPWAFVALMIAAFFVFWYGGTVLYTQTKPDDRATYFSLWVISLITVYGAFSAFFQKGLLVESIYLLMVFLAIHVSLTYKLQYINYIAAGLYLIGAFAAVYLILMMSELIRLNPTS